MVVSDGTKIDGARQTSCATVRGDARWSDAVEAHHDDAAEVAAVAVRKGTGAWSACSKACPCEPFLAYFAHSDRQAADNSGSWGDLGRSRNQVGTAP